MHEYIEFEIAMCAIDNKLYKSALDLLEAFLRKYPNSPNASKAHFTVASCHFQMNDKEKAIEVWKVVAKKYPHTDEGKEALRNVRLLEQSE